MSRRYLKRHLEIAPTDSKPADKLQPCLMLTLLLLVCGWVSPAAAQSGGTVISSGPLEKIYFTDGGDDTGGAPTVRSVNPDGTGLQTLVPDAGFRPRGIVLDPVNNYLYWNDFGDPNTVDGEPGLTQRSNLNGSNVEIVFNHGQSGVNDIELDIDAGQLYVTANPVDDVLDLGFLYSGVRQIDLTDLTKVDLPLPPGTFTDGVTLDLTAGPPQLYYGDPDILSTSSFITRADLDGNNFVDLISPPSPDGLGRGFALDVDRGHMYFARHDFASPSTGGGIYRANLDGSGLVEIVTGLKRPRDVALDLYDDRIYWVDEEEPGTIGRANLAGLPPLEAEFLQLSPAPDPGGPDALTGPNSLTLQAGDPPIIDPDVRTQGFWKRVCDSGKKRHPSGEHERIPLYVDCVKDTGTFADVASAADICDRLNPNPKNDKCEQAEAQFMALLLNVCSVRVANSNPVLDPDLGATTVGQVIIIIDVLLSNENRSREDCVLAQAIADRINNGVTLVPVP